MTGVARSAAEAPAAEARADKAVDGKVVDVATSDVATSDVATSEVATSEVATSEVATSEVVPARPAPQPSDLTAGYWEAAAEGRLVIQRCDDCGTLRHYPQHLCPDCRSFAWSWSTVSGRGTIYSYTVTHKPFHPAFKDLVPYALITVELDEGVRVMSDVPTDDLDAVQIGKRVEVFFTERDGVTYPRFKVVDDSSS